MFFANKSLPLYLLTRLQRQSERMRKYTCTLQQKEKIWELELAFEYINSNQPRLSYSTNICSTLLFPTTLLR